MALSKRGISILNKLDGQTGPKSGGAINKAVGKVSGPDAENSIQGNTVDGVAEGISDFGDITGLAGFNFDENGNILPTTNESASQDNAIVAEATRDTNSPLPGFSIGGQDAGQDRDIYRNGALSQQLLSSQPGDNGIPEAPPQNFNLGQQANSNLHQNQTSTGNPIQDWLNYAHNYVTGGGSNNGGSSGGGYSGGYSGGKGGIGGGYGHHPKPSPANPREQLFNELEKTLNGNHNAHISFEHKGGDLSITLSGVEDAAKLTSIINKAVAAKFDVEYGMGPNGETIYTFTGNGNGTEAQAFVESVDEVEHMSDEQRQGLEAVTKLGEAWDTAKEIASEVADSEVLSLTNKETGEKEAVTGKELGLGLARTLAPNLTAVAEATYNTFNKEDGTEETSPNAELAENQENETSQQEQEVQAEANAQETEQQIAERAAEEAATEDES